MRERERERGRETDRETETQTEWQAKGETSGNGRMLEAAHGPWPALPMACTAHGHGPRPMACTGMSTAKSVGYIREGLGVEQARQTCRLLYTTSKQLFI